MFPWNTIYQQNQEKPVNLTNLNNFFWWLSDEDLIKSEFNVMQYVIFTVR